MCGRYMLTTPVDALRQLFLFTQRPNLAAALQHRADPGRADRAPDARWRRARADHGALGPGAVLGRRSEDRQPPDQRARARAWRAPRRSARPISAAAAWCRPTASSNGRRAARRRQPLLVRRKDQAPFAFAGLWERWPQPGGAVLRSCTIITCPPNELVAPVHDRMPVILAPEDYARWLDPAQADGRALLKPCPAGWLEAFAVSPRVNSPQQRRSRVHRAACGAGQPALRRCRAQSMAADFRFHADQFVVERDGRRGAAGVVFSRRARRVGREPSAARPTIDADSEQGGSNAANQARRRGGDRAQAVAASRTA